MVFNLDKSAIKIKRLEEEIADLKSRFDKLNDDSMKIWERDIRISIIIDGILQGPNINMEITRKLEEINHHIKIPGSCKLFNDQIDELNAKIEKMDFEKQELERELANNESKLLDKDKDNEELTATLEKASESFKQNFDQLKSNYEKKLLEMNIQKNRLIDENNVRKKQLMILKKASGPMMELQEENTDKAWSEKEANLINKVEKLEEMLLNKEKEFNAVLRQSQYFRQAANMWYNFSKHQNSIIFNFDQ